MWGNRAGIANSCLGGNEVVYDNNYLYRVDPRTMLVQQVLSAILRP